MHQTLTDHQAASILADDNHSTFSFEGGLAVVEFLEEMEADSGSMEFDPIAIRCEFSEYPSATEAARQLLSEREFAELIDPMDCGEYASDREELFMDYFRDEGQLVAVFFGGVILRDC